jgi:hypothetical protein
MTVGMELNIWRDRLSELTTSENNINPTLQPSAMVVSPTIGTPQIRGPFLFKEQQTGADDHGCDHQTNCNAIVKPSQLVRANVDLLPSRLRCLPARFLQCWSRTRQLA